MQKEEFTQKVRNTSQTKVTQESTPSYATDQSNKDMDPTIISKSESSKSVRQINLLQANSEKKVILQKKNANIGKILLSNKQFDDDFVNQIIFSNSKSNTSQDKKSNKSSLASIFQNKRLVESQNNINEVDATSSENKLKSQRCIFDENSKNYQDKLKKRNDKERYIFDYNQKDQLFQKFDITHLLSEKHNSMSLSKNIGIDKNIDFQKNKIERVKNISTIISQKQISLMQEQMAIEISSESKKTEKFMTPQKCVRPIEFKNNSSISSSQNNKQNQKQDKKDEDSSSNGFSDSEDSDKKNSSGNNSIQDESDNEGFHIHDVEKQLQKIEIQKQQEIQQIKEYALKNGLISNIESKNISNNIDFNEQQKNQEKAQQFIDREKLLKQLYVPPPLEILFKKNFIKEPVRTGFNQGMIPLNIKYNFEAKRSVQGPQIINSKQIISKKREQLEKMKTHSKSMTRDTSIPKLDQLQKSDQLGKNMDIQKKLVNVRQFQSANKDQNQGTTTIDQILQDDDQQQQKIHLIQQAYQNETSLRHLFYLEYKKNFPDGQINPIVYSRFGKSNYDSDEKFDINNFNQLIRTCNLNKILRESEQENESKTKNKDKSQFHESVSYPQTDYYTPRDQNDKTLVFESRFESGNLQLAHKVSDNEYNLVIQNDINSKGHTQWFYFRVNNAKKGIKVKFNMLNMIKNKSLYNDGMKVLMYSLKKQQNALEQSENNQEAFEENKENFGWVRGGDDLGYFQNHYKKDYNNNFQRCYFTFTFTHTFEHDNDTVYFAYSLPYTYTDLTEYLCDIQSRQLNFVTRNTLCRTIAGNKCEYLTITNRVPYEVDKKKEGVVLTARIHPGESIASFMMKGIIDFLVSSEPQAIELRDKFVFKIIPMLNPDGVINGNYRCSLAGCDLNRRWKYPSQVLHPTVYHTKKLILKLASERHLALYCDIHAHSRRKNVFIYGNSFDDQPQHPRAFPFLMSKLAQPNFSYDYSRFNYCKSKEQTARIAIWRELGCKIPNIFTMEASFCGPKAVKYEPHRKNKKISQSELNYHFTTNDFLKIGRNLCETILLYRQEKEETIMGIQNLEFQVEQYHIEKENRIEQESLIQQQMQNIDQRKFYEIQNIKNKISITPIQNNVNQTIPENIKNIGSQKKDIENQQPQSDKNIQKNQKSGKKYKKINKKQSFSEDTIVNKTECLEQVQEQKQVKKKVNYNIRNISDESDAQSDSQPSEDNLDPDQILKLIPKKFGKKKYISGVEDNEKQKKNQQKQKEKKPKTELMPCLQNKKKELEELKKKETEAAEKILQKKLKLSQSISRTQVFKRNGIYMRDIATHIQYKGDSQNLSFMESDILKATGCVWSRIIYSGFKGYTNPLEKYDLSRKNIDKTDKNIKFEQILHFESQGYQQVSPLNEKDKNHFDLGKQLINEKQINQNAHFNQNLYKNQYDILFNKNKEMLMGGQSLQFQNKKNESNENSQDSRYKIIPQQTGSRNLQLNSQNQENHVNLQQKIQETKFFEARSLMGAFGQSPSLQLSNQKKQVLRQNLFEYGIDKGQDIQKVMSQDFKSNESKFDKQNEKKLPDFDQFEDKQHQKSSYSASKSNKVNNLEEYKLVKKIINGMIVTQKMQQTQKQNLKSPKDFDQTKMLRINDLLDSAHSDMVMTQLRSQQKSNSINPQHKQFQDIKSNFSQVGQQILIQKPEGNKAINLLSLNDDRFIQSQYCQKRQVGLDLSSKPQLQFTGKQELSFLNNTQVQPFVCPQIVNSSKKLRAVSTDKNKDDLKQEGLSMKQLQMERIQNIQRQSKLLSYL